MKLETKNLRESFTMEGAAFDTDAGLVRDVKVLGLESANRRRYTQEAIGNAVSQYERAKINFDHPDTPNKSRGYRDRFALLINCHLAEDGAFRADLMYNPEHAEAKSFAWWAKNAPEAIGLSHNAVGQGKTDAAGIFVIEKILSVRSVDIVADPASTKGLFEGIMNPEPTPVDVTGDDAATHLGNAMMAVCKDDTLDAAAKKKKVLGLLKLMDDSEPEPAPAPEKPEPEKKTAEESIQAFRATPHGKQLIERLDALEAEKALASKTTKARQLCEEAKLPTLLVTSVFLESLVEAKDEKAMKSLIEDRRQIAAIQKPKSSGKGGVNSGSGMDLKTFSKQLKQGA